MNPAMPGAVPVNPMAMPSAPDKKGSLVGTIILVFVCLIAAAAIVMAVMFYMNWRDVQTNVETQIEAAKIEAAKTQKDIDEKAWVEREKTPNSVYTGPSDYGSLSFNYPKTWSVYVDSDGLSNNDFKAYFAPVEVNNIKDSTSRYALRFFILNKDYDTVQKTYQNKVSKGDMTYSVFQADNSSITGSLFKGTIEKQIIGQVLVVKINDKTAVLQTDAEDYYEDFEKLIKSLRRNS